MAIITEDYVSFETAELLKKKGFDSESITAYYFFMEGSEPILNRIEPQHFVNQCGGNISLVGCPTLQMAMKWLREVHNCPIEILWHWNANSQCSEWYFVHHMELKPLPQIQYYDTYEQACEEGIKYCLENLI